MDIEILGFLGLVFALTSLSAIAYERCTDVLSGSHLEGGDGSEPGHSARQLWEPSLIDRLRWKTQAIIYVASVIT
jgi:hypothetical protein